LMILLFPTYRPKYNLNLYADFPIKQGLTTVKGFQRPLQSSIKFLLVLLSTNILKQ
jgi:hypothetical protein